MARSHHHEKFRLEDGLIGYIITLFHNKRMLSGVLTACVVLIGLLFAVRVRREVMPNVQASQYTVSISYPGASPEQVEQDAVIPVEDVLKTISGISSYSSTSQQGSGSIQIALDEDAPNPIAIGDAIYRKMNLGNIPDLGPEVNSISVDRRVFSEMSIYMISLSRSSEEKVDDLTFYRAADSLASQLENLTGVGKVELEGYREQQVEINVDPELLNAQYFDISSVVNAIENRNVSTTAGTLEDPENYKMIVSINEYQDLEELRNTILRSRFDDNRVLLRDVAQVNRVFPRKDLYIRTNLKESISLTVYKTSSADIVKAAAEVKSFLREQGNTLLPDGIQWVEIYDEGHGVDQVSKVLIKNGIIGFLLILLVLFIFLDFTTAFWTACGLPITMILTLAFMGVTGLSANYLTLTAMITMIGMLVDHGIVISEAIFARRLKGVRPLRAAIEGLKSVFWPVVVTVSTTIMAFLPMLMIEGEMGKFTRFFPILVTVMLSVSFLEACFLLVSHLLHSRSNFSADQARTLRNIAAGRLPHDTWFSPLIRVYQATLRVVLFFRWPIQVIFLLLLALGIWISLPAIRNFDLFHNTDSSFIVVNYLPAAGTTLEQAQEAAKQLEQRIVDVTPEENQIKYVHNRVSENLRGEINGAIIIYLVDKKDRVISFGDYNKLLNANLLPYGKRSRMVLKNQLGAKDDRSFSSPDRDPAKVDNPYILSPEELTKLPVLFDNVRIDLGGGAGPPGGRAISIRLYSDDVKELSAAGAAAADLLESLRGTQNIQNSGASQVEQIRVAIDYPKMARFGVQLWDINNTLRTAFQGTTATQSRSGTKTTEYIVRLQEPYRKSIDTILSLAVQTDTGEFIPLSHFAQLVTEFSSPSIQHYNGHRSLRLTGDVDPDIEGVTSLLIGQQFTERFTEIKNQYPSVTLDLSGGEAENSLKFIKNMASASVVAVLLILLILILLFDSFFQPLIVIGAIPFGLVGGLVALQLHNIPVSLMAVIGFMGLIGVVVNDSVVMVQFINYIVHRYPHVRSRLLGPLVLKGAGRRLRAVLLTTLTTVLGLFPTMYGLGGDPGFVRPVVLVLGYGLLAATVITLFFIPTVYMIHLDLCYGFNKCKKMLFSRRR